MDLHIWNGRIGIGLLAASAFLAACAISEPTAENGQSHWLESCSSDMSCGGLTCLCGLCTAACSDDGSCGAKIGSSAVCRRAEACGQAQVGSMCLPAEPIAREDAAASVSEPAPMTDSDALLGQLRDLGDQVAVQVPRSVEPPQVDCKAIESDSLPAGVERVASGTALSAITSFGGSASWVDDEELRHKAGPTAEIDTLAHDVREVIQDGTELFFSTSTTLTKLSLSDRIQVDVAVLPATANLNLNLALDDGAVYWPAGDEDGMAIWRGERGSGEVSRLGRLDDRPVLLSSVIDDWFYALAVVAISDRDESQLFRLRTDGSQPAELVGEPVTGVTDIVGDANGLFASMWTRPGGESMRVVRIEPESGRVDPLYEMRAVMNLAIDATYVYWMGGRDGETAAVWRGRRDGQGSPSPLIGGAAFLPGTGRISIADGWVYFTVYCDSGVPNYLLRIAKPKP